jgi:hypothetical protein
MRNADELSSCHQRQLPSKHAQPRYNDPGFDHQGQRVCQLEA